MSSGGIEKVHIIGIIRSEFTVLVFYFLFYYLFLISKYWVSNKWSEFVLFKIFNYFMVMAEVSTSIGLLKS